MSEGVGFGNYRLLRRLARGGMAEVFLARQEGVEGFQRRVAIKRILPHLSDSAEFRTMFLDEARLAAQLSNPNIIHIYDFGKVDDYYFIAMEYVEGVDLGRIIKQVRTSPMPFHLIARVLADICAGLHYAHNVSDGAGKKLNVVHRDVTPQNVLVTYDGVVKVVDFGIAKATWQASRTRPGVVKGKYAYMSPEQVEGRSLDARSDIFSVGICMFELMTGMPLFRRDNVTEAMKEIRDGKPIHPEAHREGIPPELMAILKKSLENSRDARYASAQAMQMDLERYLKNATELATPQLLGEALRRELPPGPLGEVLTEGKADPGGAGAPPALEPTPPPPAVAPPSSAKGGTAQMSSLKQAVTPAYDNMPIFGSDPATREPAAPNSGEDPTTPGRSLRSSAVRGFESDDDEDLTRRDDRPQPPLGTSAEPTVRSPKFGDSLDGMNPSEATVISEQRTQSGKLAAHPRASQSGQQAKVSGSRSGSFPGSPLGQIPATHSNPELAGEPTSQLDNPKQPARAAVASRVPWIVAGVVALGAALTLSSPSVRSMLGIGAHVPPPKPVDPVTKPDTPVTPPTAKGAPDAAPQVVTTELPVQTSAILGINTRPSGAKVFVDGEPLEMLTPVRTQPVTAGPHHLVIQRVGYAPREEDISLHAGEHRVLDFELPEEKSLQSTPTNGKHHSGGGSPSTPHVAGNGLLTVKTVPYSRVYDGDTLLGETTLVNVPLAEGSHTLTFVNPDTKQSVKRRVTIKVGETTRLSFSLSEN